MEAMVAAGCAVELADADEAAVQRWLAERGRELAKGEAAAAVAEVEEGWGGGGLRSGRRAWSASWSASWSPRAPSWRAGWLFSAVPTLGSVVVRRTAGAGYPCLSFAHRGTRHGRQSVLAKWFQLIHTMPQQPLIHIIPVPHITVFPHHEQSISIGNQRDRGGSQGIRPAISQLPSCELARG